MALNFNKYAQEGNECMKNLATKQGHPDQIPRTGIILRAVMHTLRERLTISENLHLMAQLPMFLKAVYVDNWKYREKPLQLSTLDEFTEEVKKYQSQYGENEFNWEKHTKDIVSIVLQELVTYVSKGESEHIKAQLPKELEEFFSQSVKK